MRLVQELFWVMLAISLTGVVVLAFVDALAEPQPPAVVLTAPTNITYFAHAIEVVVPGVDGATFGKMRCVQPTNLMIGLCLSPALLVQVKF